MRVFIKVRVGDRIKILSNLGYTSDGKQVKRFTYIVLEYQRYYSGSQYIRTSLNPWALIYPTDIYDIL